MIKLKRDKWRIVPLGEICKLEYGNNLTDKMRSVGFTKKLVQARSHCQAGCHDFSFLLAVIVRGVRWRTALVRSRDCPFPGGGCATDGHFCKIQAKPY